MLAMQRLLVAGTFVLIAACGQEEPPAAATTASALTAPDYACENGAYSVVAYRSPDGKFGRVTLAALAPPRPLRDFTDYDDVTTAHSDIVFSGRFRSKTKADDPYVVEIDRGGYTLGVNAKVEERVLGQTFKVTNLTCKPRSAS